MAPRDRDELGRYVIDSNPGPKLRARGVRTRRGCLEWPGATNGKGYGVASICGKRQAIHRWVLMQREPPPFPGAVARHTCDNPACFEDGHLIWGTRADNQRDMVERGRQVRPNLHGTKSPRAKLTAADVTEIRRVYAGRRGQQVELARRFKVSTKVIWKVVHGQGYKED